jgi:hypothetical protein
MTAKRSLLRTTIVVVAVLATLLALLAGYVVRERHKHPERLVHALAETDYQALLNACRDLSRRAAAGGPTFYSLRRTRSWLGRGTPSPGAASLPKVILDLDPVLVRVDHDGRVWVALYVYPNQGLFAYPENYPVYPGVHLGSVELIRGLWFSDQMYDRESDPEFVSYVDRLILKGKERQGSPGKGGIPGGN